MGSAQSMPVDAKDIASLPDYRTLPVSGNLGDASFAGRYNHDQMNSRSDANGSRARSNDASSYKKACASARNLSIKLKKDKRLVQSENDQEKTPSISSGGDKSSPSSPARSNDNDTTSRSHRLPSTLPLVAKEAKRSISISNILKNAEKYQFIDEVTQNRCEHETKQKSNEKKPKKRRSMEEESSVNDDEKLPNTERTSKRMKRASKPTAKKLESEGKQLSDEKRSKKENMHTAPVPCHVLLSADVPLVTSSKKSLPSVVKKAVSKIDLYSVKSQELFDNEFVDSVGPPRTDDQNSDIVTSPHIHDILMGRGNGVAQWPGNCVFRIFCWNAREAYHKAVRNEKGRVADHIIEKVKSRNPPGRFLERGSDDYYTEVPHERVKEKICQALREKKWMPNAKDEISCNNYEISSNKSTFAKAMGSTASSTKEKIDANVAGKNDPASTSFTSKIASNKKSFASARTSLLETMKEYRTGTGIQTGTRVAVFWPLDDKYYDATVVQSHPKNTDYFFLKYDDDESEWLDLKSVKHKIIRTPNPPCLEQTNVAKKRSHHRKLPLTAAASLKIETSSETTSSDPESPKKEQSTKIRIKEASTFSKSKRKAEASLPKVNSKELKKQPPLTMPDQ
jgi:hypothetical protein